MDRVSDRPWSRVSASSYPSAAAYCAACVIDLNAAGAAKVKARCKLPVYEPPSLGGLLNRHAVRAAADRLLGAGRGVDAPSDVQAGAALRLLRLFAAIGETAPPRLVKLAGARGANVLAPSPPSRGFPEGRQPDAAL